MLGMADPYLKIGRAKRHLEALDIELAAFCSSPNAYTLTRYDDLEHGRHILKTQLAETPDDIPLIAGDAVNCMRASLDQIVYSLAHKTITIPEGTQFPFLDFPLDDSTSKGRDALGRFNKHLKGVPDEAIQEIKSFQPYNRGTAYQSHPLWRLNAICNLDKHRRIAANGSELLVHFPKFSQSLRHLIVEESFDDYGILSVPLAHKDKLQFNPSVTFKVNFGGIAYWKDGIVGGTILYYPPYTRDEFWQIYDFISNTVLPRFIRFLA